MAGPRLGEPALLVGGAGRVLDRQGVFPVGPVFVFDLEGDGRADGLPVADAGKNFHFIALDLHPPAAPVAGLAAAQLAVDEGRVHGHAQGQARDDGRQALPVRLPRRLNAQHRPTILADPAYPVKSPHQGWVRGVVGGAGEICVQNASETHFRAKVGSSATVFRG